MSEQTLKRVDLIFGEYSNEKYKVLASTLQRNNEEILNDILESGLRGRGGAGFPTAMKWKFTAETVSDEKFVVCNADEANREHSKIVKSCCAFPVKCFQGWRSAGGSSVQKKD